MTTRLKGLTVSFDHDIREDDAETLIAAIRCLRGVLAVTTIEADMMGDWIVESRVRSELSDKLWEVLHPKVKS